jgi:hypothetical protein
VHSVNVAAGGGFDEGAVNMSLGRSPCHSTSLPEDAATPLLYPTPTPGRVPKQSSRRDVCHLGHGERLRERHLDDLIQVSVVCGRTVLVFKEGRGTFKDVQTALLGSLII